MKLYLKSHYIDLNRIDGQIYNISCGCGHDENYYYYDDAILACVRHVDYSYRDYEFDLRWFNNWDSIEENIKEKQRDIVQDTRIPLEEVENRIGILEGQRERYEALEIVLPVVHKFFASQKV